MTDKIQAELEQTLTAERDHARDAMREQAAQLRETQTRLEATLAAGGIATWTWDLRTNRIFADDALVRLFSLSPEDAAGGPPEAYLKAIHPDDRPHVAALLANITVHGGAYETEYRVVLPDGSHRWLAARGRVGMDDAGTPATLPGVVLDVTERVERERRERFVAEMVERARGMSDADTVIADAVRSVGEFLGVSRCVFADIDFEADTCTISPDYRADASVVSIEGSFPISAFGAFVVAEYQAGRTAVVDDVYADRVKAPSESLSAYDAIGVRAYIAAPVMHSARLVSAIAVHSAVPRYWNPEEIALLQTVVERTWLTVEVLRQQQTIALETRESRRAHERTAEILESITDAFFALDADWNFTYVNAEAERVLFRSRANLLGRNVWEEFPAAVGSFFEREYRHAMGEQVAVSFEEYFPPLDAWFVVRAYPSASGISVFFQDVTLRKNAETERERLRAEQQAQAEREALISRIGLALRDSNNAEAARETAATLLGQALGADRCYFALYDLAGGTVRVSQDWHRADLSSVSGLYPFANTAAMFRELYRDSRTSVIADADTAALSPQTRANMEGLQIRSRVSVALADADGLAAILTAAMADGPREWTTEEVALMEAAATQLRIGVEAARVQQREHRIATQLQEALQPEPPSSVPGLSVGRFTRPALDEAQIGGDFYDVFALDKTLYAVVIGDVSGKGLAAAQQLALIRNSLRTTLYLVRQPARAAAALNAIVTAHNLLVGFVTTFVGIYDAVTGRIVYCCCGHEPGLVRRHGSTVETLETTGPPLGVAENAEYTEEAFTLASGDTLLLYTDGISEAGVSRRAMLGTEGLSKMLSALPPGPDAQTDAEALVAEVSAYTSGIFRDDVAVLMVRRR